MVPELHRTLVVRCWGEIYIIPLRVFVAPVFIKKQDNLDQPCRGVGLVGKGGLTSGRAEPPQRDSGEKGTWVRALSEDITSLLWISGYPGWVGEVEEDDPWPLLDPLAIQPHTRSSRNHLEAHVFPISNRQGTNSALLLQAFVFFSFWVSLDLCFSPLFQIEKRWGKSGKEKITDLCISPRKWLRISSPPGENLEFWTLTLSHWPWDLRQPERQRKGRGKAGPSHSPPAPLSVPES